MRNQSNRIESIESIESTSLRAEDMVERRRARGASRARCLATLAFVLVARGMDVARAESFDRESSSIVVRSSERRARRREMTETTRETWSDAVNDASRACASSEDRARCLTRALRERMERRAAGRAGRDVRGERGDATRDDDAERGRVGGPGDAPRDVRERGARDWTGLFGDERVRRVGGRGDGGCVKGVAETPSSARTRGRREGVRVIW